MMDFLITSTLCTHVQVCKILLKELDCTIKARPMIKLSIFNHRYNNALPGLETEVAVTGIRVTLPCLHFELFLVIYPSLHATCAELAKTNSCFQ